MKPSYAVKMDWTKQMTITLMECEAVQMIFKDSGGYFMITAPSTFISQLWWGGLMWQQLSEWINTRFSGCFGGCSPAPPPPHHDWPHELPELPLACLVNWIISGFRAKAGFVLALFVTSTFPEISWEIGRGGGGWGFTQLSQLAYK